VSTCISKTLKNFLSFLVANKLTSVLFFPNVKILKPYWNHNLEHDFKAAGHWRKTQWELGVAKLIQDISVTLYHVQIQRTSSQLTEWRKGLRADLMTNMPQILR
jgi:hypothetical protein